MTPTWPGPPRPTAHPPGKEAPTHGSESSPANGPEISAKKAHLNLSAKKHSLILAQKKHIVYAGCISLTKNQKYICLSSDI